MLNNNNSRGNKKKKVERDLWGGPASCPKCGGPVRRLKMVDVLEVWDYDREIHAWGKIDEERRDTLERTFVCQKAGCGHTFTREEVDRAEGYHYY